MSIIRQLTEAEADLQAKEQLVLQAGEATHHLASVLATTNAMFWSLPTDRLLAVLNADVPATLATFTANTALGTMVNASLDALAVARFAARAPVEMGRTDIVFDGAAFVYVAPPEPEPQPEPQPEP
jgi:hypothetical protein